MWELLFFYRFRLWRRHDDVWREVLGWEGRREGGSLRVFVWRWPGCVRYFFGQETGGGVVGPATVSHPMQLVGILTTVGFRGRRGGGLHSLPRMAVVLTCCVAPLQYWDGVRRLFTDEAAIAEFRSSRRGMARSVLACASHRRAGHTTARLGSTRLGAADTKQGSLTHRGYIFLFADI